MSICSAMSDMSVSYYGEDVNLEEALDETFKKIQTFVNDCHYSVRSLAMSDEQDGDYLLALDQYHEIIISIDGMLSLMTELKSISKEVLGSAPKDLKIEVSTKILEFKRKQLKIKTDAKAEKEANKEKKNLDEIKE